jgi:Glycosyltransferase family 87
VIRKAKLESAFAPLMALLGVAAMSWLGLYSFAWNDYENEALPAMNALLAGHFERFAQLAPAYGGSLLLRAPFAFLPRIWGGGELAVYQAISVPCLLAAALLSLWLLARMRKAGQGRLARGLALGLCVANPLTLRALELGHPEELLDACMCVAAVLLLASQARPAKAGRLALDSRALCAGVLLGLAIGSKEWALLALGPALLVQRHRHWQTLVADALAAVALLAPIALLSPSFVSATKGAASTGSAIFQPWQAFWFLGKHGAMVHGTFGAPKPGYRIAPAWLGPISHPLVLLCGLVVPLALWRRRRGAALQVSEALLCLALLMSLRCLLDTWDNVYYTVPLLIALLAYEVSAYVRPPVVALSVTLLCWASFQWLPEMVSPDLQAAFFLAWAAPLTIALAIRLFAPELRLAARRGLSTASAAS